MIRSTMQTQPMCLYPKLILNKKYVPNRKNNYNAPERKDNRVKYVPIGCGQCIECRAQKAREWQVRLTEELKVNIGYFVTLTFSPQAFSDISEEIGAKNTLNVIAALAVRRFLERYRKKHKKSLRHWLITELGHTNTERLHLHGLLFTNEKLDKDEIEKLWKYGNIFIGDYCSTRTINYIVKYVTKIDTEHKNYKQLILASAGLGKNYINSTSKLIHKYKPKQTADYYTLPNGQKINLPIYYRNKLFSEEEREQLWLELLDKKERFVRGIKIENIDTEEGWHNYEATLKEAQKENINLGYGDDSKEWRSIDYNITARMLNKEKRTQKYYTERPTLENLEHNSQKTEKS